MSQGCLHRLSNDGSPNADRLSLTLAHGLLNFNICYWSFNGSYVMYQRGFFNSPKDTSSQNKLSQNTNYSTPKTSNCCHLSANYKAVRKNVSNFAM